MEYEQEQETEEALRSLLHYIDNSGTWPDDSWNMDRVRKCASK